MSTQENLHMHLKTLHDFSCGRSESNDVTHLVENKSRDLLELKPMPLAALTGCSISNEEDRLRWLSGYNTRLTIMQEEAEWVKSLKNTVTGLKVICQSCQLKQIFYLELPRERVNVDNFLFSVTLIMIRLSFQINPIKVQGTESPVEPQIVCICTYFYVS